MEVQTVEKKPNTGKQTVTATEETSSVAERTKEVKYYTYIIHIRSTKVHYSTTRLLI